MRKAIFTAIIGGSLAFAGTAAIGAMDDAAAEAAMKKAGCSACHAVDKKLVGPSYKDVAAKRKGAGDAAAMLVKKVREGGKGEYGQIPMPPNAAAKISDGDLNDLVAWILTK